MNQLANNLKDYFNGRQTCFASIGERNELIS
jgi:hypothetical protein